MKGSWLKKYKKYSLVSRLSKVPGIFNPQQRLALLLTALSQLFFPMVLAAVGLHCCVWVFTAACGSSLLHVGLLWLWRAGATPVAGHGLLSLSAPALESGGSGVLARRLSCPTACGIFPDQGWNSYLLHWQACIFTTEPPGKSILSQI